MTKKEIEKKVLESFERQRGALTQRMGNVDKNEYKNSRYVKIIYYYDDGNIDNWSPKVIDIAVWDFVKDKFIAIEYPWELKNGKIRYYRIKLC